MQSKRDINKYGGTMKTGRRALAEKLREESQYYKRSRISCVAMGLVLVGMLILIGIVLGI